MKIVQIATGPNRITEEIELFGLDEQGNVYIYRRGAGPFVTKVPVTDPEALQQCNRYYPQGARNIGQQVQQMLDELPELPDLQHNAFHQRVMKEQEARHRHDMERLRILGQVQGPRYVDQFHDGWTEGWEPLKMGISKPVPHPDDPTRNERA